MAKRGTGGCRGAHEFYSLFNSNGPLLADGKQLAQRRANYLTLPGRQTKDTVKEGLDPFMD